MALNGEKLSPDQAAKKLGRLLCGRVPHVVGVSLGRSATSALTLSVQVDSEDAREYVPSYFEGYPVEVVVVTETPRFGRVW
jgi:hypothetical protein